MDTWNGICNCKAWTSISNVTKIVTAITVAEMLPTRPPMKLGERPMVSAIKGVVIIFLATGITTPNLQSSLPLVSAF